MKRFTSGLLMALFISLCPAFRASAQPTIEALRSLDPTAEELLTRVKEALPDTSIALTARMEARTQRGKREKTCKVEMLLDWGRETPAARYTISDAFGQPLERLDITWPEGGQPAFAYFTGKDLDPAEVPVLTEPIDGFDFTWADLSLGFLWWPGGRVSGMEKNRGRLCYVVDIPAPDEATNDYAGVRVWIDPEVNMLLQAEGYDHQGERMRKLQVKSFKKVDELWTIQDIDVTSYPSRHKTILRVQDVEAEPPPAEQDASDPAQTHAESDIES
ncbi:MAG: outer membrane lipoprotein-sorting protein [Spartobacteria bacterium]|nr:outer membrane lipoprotein-sorting protein [Spartobacteria bacterium]